ncbi:MAG: hypothetical protein OEW83_12675, partial [Acidimicrobiia bacterium]|nr:hypothetical protein [Acidimicrobiia bacterium]
MSDQVFDALVETARSAVQEAQARAVDAGKPRLSYDAMEAVVVDAVREGISRHANDQVRLGQRTMSDSQEQAMLRRVVRFVTGLGPVEELLADDDVEEIYGHYDYVQIDKDGQPVAVVRDLWPSEQAMVQWLSDLARNRGLTERQFNSGSPLLVLRLKAGMRLSAVRDVSQRAMFNLRRNTLT